MIPSKEELTKELTKEANKEQIIEYANKVTILYGDTGKRKTTTACSMVGERGLLLNSDESAKVLLNPRHADLKSKITPVALEGISQIEYVDFSNYDTIIWDTVSQSVDTFLDLLYDESDWGGKYREKLKTTSKELKGLEVLAPVDYRVTRDWIRPALNRMFKEANAHIILTCQMRTPLPGLSADSVCRPDIPNATFKVMATRADLIANIRPEGKNFVVDLTENSLSYLAKSRIEGLQGKMSAEAFVATYKELVFK